MINLLSVLASNDDGYRVFSQDGQDLLCLEEATLDAAVVLGIKHRNSYRG